MKYTRIYADAAGESHLQDVDPAMKPAGNACGSSKPYPAGRSLRPRRVRQMIFA